MYLSDTEQMSLTLIAKRDCYTRRPDVTEVGNVHTTDSEANPHQVAASWDTYWHGTGDADAYSSGGVSHPAIQAFWNEFFRTVKQDYDAPRIIDIASGNGAVIECAFAVLGRQRPEFTSVDVSAAAIKNIRSRFPEVRGVVADARSIPLDPGGFEIVASQFGVEYAGVTAVEEAARLVAPEGRLALLLHSQQSSIHKECEESLDAIVRLKESNFIPYAARMFEAGFKACRGGDRAPYEAAATKLAPSVKALESIMAQYGQHVAGDTVARLYSDVDRMHQAIQRYEPAEVLDWLVRMDGELDAYVGRMSSMCRAALDTESFERVCADLRQRGYTTLHAGPLMAPGQGRPLAWALVAINGFPAV